MEKVYKGLTYIASYRQVDNDSAMAFYTAYVKLPPRHPYIKLCRKGDYDGMDISVHGGLTFAYEVKTESEESSQNFTKGCWIGLDWIGWDYGHSGDQIWDLERLKTWSPEIYKIEVIKQKRLKEFPFLKEHRWTEEEVEVDCKKVIDQLLQI